MLKPTRIFVGFFCCILHRIAMRVYLMLFNAFISIIISTCLSFVTLHSFVSIFCFKITRNASHFLWSECTVFLLFAVINLKIGLCNSANKSQNGEKDTKFRGRGFKSLKRSKTVHFGEKPTN